MKKVLFIVYIASFVFGVKAANPGHVTVENARHVFEQVWYFEQSGHEFLKASASIETTSPLIKGYRGAIMMMMAKYGYNPYTKWHAFKQGKLLLEQAIAEGPTQLELVFLRFCIQTNAPSILGYTSNIYLDLNRLKKAMNTLEDKELRLRIIKYMNRPEIAKLK